MIPVESSVCGSAARACLWRCRRSARVGDTTPAEAETVTVTVAVAEAVQEVTVAEAVQEVTVQAGTAAQLFAALPTAGATAFATSTGVAIGAVGAAAVLEVVAGTVAVA